MDECGVKAMSYVLDYLDKVTLERLNVVCGDGGLSASLADALKKKNELAVVESDADVRKIMTSPYLDSVLCLRIRDRTKDMTWSLTWSLLEQLLKNKLTHIVLDAPRFWVPFWTTLPKEVDELVCQRLTVDVTATPNEIDAQIPPQRGAKIKCLRVMSVPFFDIQLLVQRLHTSCDPEAIFLAGCMNYPKGWKQQPQGFVMTFDRIYPRLKSITVYAATKVHLSTTLRTFNRLQHLSLNDWCDFGMGPRGLGVTDMMYDSDDDALREDKGRVPPHEYIPKSLRVLTCSLPQLLIHASKQNIPLTVLVYECIWPSAGRAATEPLRFPALKSLTTEFYCNGPTNLTEDLEELSQSCPAIEHLDLNVVLRAAATLDSIKPVLTPLLNSFKHTPLKYLRLKCSAKLVFHEDSDVTQTLATVAHPSLKWVTLELNSNDNGTAFNKITFVDGVVTNDEWTRPVYNEFEIYNETAAHRTLSLVNSFIQED